MCETSIRFVGDGRLAGSRMPFERRQSDAFRTQAVGCLSNAARSVSAVGPLVQSLQGPSMGLQGAAICNHSPSSARPPAQPPDSGCWFCSISGPLVAGTSTLSGPLVAGTGTFSGNDSRNAFSLQLVSQPRHQWDCKAQRQPQH